MKHPLRSSVCTEGRRMAGARALWVAAGMKHEQFGKPIIAIVNSFTQFVPGHTHLHEIGQIVKKEIEAMGCYAAEFNTIAVDDGIAMGHDGMLYSLPSRDIIADSVEYMVNAHKADAMICISNCDKVTPGMLMASMRLNIPTVFCSGGPMEAGRWKGENADLITAMIKGADTSVSDEEMTQIEQCACPGCGSCSGMFTANSMNSLTEAIGLSLPGNGTILATHKNRIQLFKDAARQIVKNAYAYYEDGDESVLPRNIATRDAFLNAMTLDIAMGGSTNTVLHLLAVAQEAGADFKMEDIDQLSRKVPCLCKLSPNTQKYSVQECNRAGGILGILNELNKGGLINGAVKRVDGKTLDEQMKKYDITDTEIDAEADRISNYALDRIQNFNVEEDVAYIPNKEVDFEHYFDDVFGVTIPPSDVEKIRVLLQFSKKQYPYIVSKPLHHSQEIVDAENRILAVEVRPTYEFTQLILSFGFDVKVLGPEPFKQEILASLRRNLQNYDEMQIDCTD